MKTTILQHEEQALHYQQQLLTYKKDTEAKVLLLQSKYSEELKKINHEKHRAIQDLTKKLQDMHEKRYLDPEYPRERIKKGSCTPQEVSRSFTVLQQDTGSTGSRMIQHRRQHSDS